MCYISALANRQNNTVYVWERTPEGERVLRDYVAPYYCYYDDEDGKYKTIFDTPVSKLECKTSKDFTNAKEEIKSNNIKLWEADILPEHRVLSNHYYGVPAPQLHITFFDIEVDYDPERGFSTVEDPYAPINSVTFLHYWKKKIVVLTVPPEDGWDAERLERAVLAAEPNAPIPDEFEVEYVICHDERELLMLFLIEIEESDAICGWHSDFFDVPYTTQRIMKVLDKCEIDLSVDENTTITNTGLQKTTVKYRTDPNPVLAQCKFAKRLDFDPHITTIRWRAVTTLAGKLLGHTVDFQGRLRIDYKDLYKKYEVSEKPSYKLAAISNAVLVDDKTNEPLLPKLEYQGSLADLYRDNFPFFIRYNIRDVEILGGFERKLGYVELANQMFHMSTAMFKDVTGTLKLAECALVNYCHHVMRRVVNNITRPDQDRSIDGALVLLPQVGLHERFGSIDINSLYPSAIRSLNISPEMIRGQFMCSGDDFEEISKKSSKRLTLVLEADNSIITKTAEEWRDWLIDKKWAVSGYGTVFDQAKQGFIPALLADWYAQRKNYQALKKKALDAKDFDGAGYYDRLQFVYKIKLNSLYGALTNLYFRFYDIRMGESTTATGRVVLKHQCRKVTEVLEGKYDVDFPLYATTADVIAFKYPKAEVTEAQRITAGKIALDGSEFNGKHQSDCVIYGDTDSTYFKTYAETDEEAILIADAVAEKVNASYPDFMRQTFLCTPGYDDIIKAGREIVSDRGIFVEKKRYILHLIDLDSKSVDKMKIMGLDTKKTTLPQEVSNSLNHFIERFLKGEDWRNVSASVVQYKETLKHTTDIMSIGLPKGVKNVEEYTKTYELEGDKARLPGHVAASIHYNICLKHFNDKISPKIISGTKIKVFYLLGDHGKFKSIALPTDIEVIPEWFLTQFSVDRRAHIERLVDNPLSNILKAIGKEPPSKQSMLIDDLMTF